MQTEILIFNYNDESKFVLTGRHRLQLPNGDIFRIKWNHVEQVIELTKELSDSTESLSILPKVSNQILIK